MDTEQRRQAMVAFHRLGRRTRREVHRLASEGTTHPDPQVRTVAAAWARTVVATTMPVPPRRPGVGGPLAVAVLAAAAVTGGGPVGAGRGRDGRSENPQARREALAILAAMGEPPSEGEDAVRPPPADRP